MKQNTVFMAEIDRFGYTLRVIETTERKARNKLIKHYIETYKEWNDGADPSEDIDRWGNTYLDSMKEDIRLFEMTLGKVEWQ